MSLDEMYGGRKKDQNMGQSALLLRDEIMKLVSEHDKDGISKNKVFTILSEKRGGSKSTYQKCFKELKEKKYLESRKHTKCTSRLYPTENAKKIKEFECKIQSVRELLELLDKLPSVGDCFILDKKEKIPRMDDYQYNQLRLYKNNIESTVFGDTQNVPQVYNMNARYDILKNLPMFLTNYIYDPANNFSSALKDDFLGKILPIFTDCMQKLQMQYSKSKYYSNAFFTKQETSVIIMSVRGLDLPDPKSEFLRILGRYYFLISKDQSKYKIDSFDNQKIISKFVRFFFGKSIIPDDDLSNQIIDKMITEELFVADMIPGVAAQEYSGTNDEMIAEELLAGSHPDLEDPLFSSKPYLEEETPDDPFKIGKPPTRKMSEEMEKVVERLDKIRNETIGGKIAFQFDKYSNNDPFIVINFYHKWFFSLGIFSELEKKIIEEYLHISVDCEKGIKSDDSIIMMGARRFVRLIMRMEQKKKTQRTRL